MCFVLRSDESFYRDLLEELRNGVYKGRDEYLTTVSDAYKLLMRTYQQIGYVQRRHGRSGYRARNSGRGEGFMFTHHGGLGGRGGRGNDTDQAALPERNEILHKEIRCYSCQKKGHYLDQHPNQTVTNLSLVGVNIIQRFVDIKHTWVLIDICYTNSV